MHHVDFAKRRTHLPHFGHDTGWQCGECNVAFFQVHARFTEGNEKVAARVGIDDGLKSDFGFMHLERRCRLHRITACLTDEISDHTDVWIQRFGRRRGASVNR